MISKLLSPQFLSKPNPPKIVPGDKKNISSRRAASAFIFVSPNWASIFLGAKWCHNGPWLANWPGLIPATRTLSNPGHLGQALSALLDVA
jgi:hypothetical protein